MQFQLNCSYNYVIVYHFYNYRQKFKTHGLVIFDKILQGNKTDHFINEDNCILNHSSWNEDPRLNSRCEFIKPLFLFTVLVLSECPDAPRESRFVLTNVWHLSDEAVTLMQSNTCITQVYQSSWLYTQAQWPHQPVIQMCPPFQNNAVQDALEKHHHLDIHPKTESSASEVITSKGLTAIRMISVDHRSAETSALTTYGRSTSWTTWKLCSLVRRTL